MAFRDVLLACMTLAPLAFLLGCTGHPPSNEGKLPTITVQPQDQAVIEGQAATFTADCHTEFFITEVRWLVNGQNKALYYGQTSYTTPPTSLANDGDKVQFVVYNAYGFAESRVAVLHVTLAQAQVIDPAPLGRSASSRPLVRPGVDPHQQ